MIFTEQTILWFAHTIVWFAKIVSIFIYQTIVHHSMVCQNSDDFHRPDHSMVCPYHSMVCQNSKHFHIPDHSMVYQKSEHFHMPDHSMVCQKSDSQSLQTIVWFTKKYDFHRPDHSMVTWNSAQQTHICEWAATLQVFCLFQCYGWPMWHDDPVGHWQ